jgi:hypothetical protein
MQLFGGRAQKPTLGLAKGEKEYRTSNLRQENTIISLFRKG